MWQFFDVRASGSFDRCSAGARCRARTGFPNARLNYVEQVFRHATAARPAIVAGDETGRIEEIAWAELERRVARSPRRCARGGRAGDRVVAILPNIP